MDAEKDGLRTLLQRTGERAVRYLEGLEKRPVAPQAEQVRGLDSLPAELPETGRTADGVIELLERYGAPATVASNGSRYFGFVTGSALPAALAANWLASAWNQNGALEVLSPVATRLEAISIDWVRTLLGLPPGSDGAFVTGATMANFTALAAARHAVLERAGWDAERNGLFGAPPITVIVGEEAHASIGKVIGLLGLGRDRVIRVPADAQGRLRADAMPTVRGPSLLCLQAGNVNTGAFDPFSPLIERAHREGAWVHVDGAFGLWAAASPRLRYLVQGVAAADSWALDGHKWLNVPYDSGLVFVREPRHLRAAMSSPAAAYLSSGAPRDRFDLAPEQSRRARGIDAWAALLSVGSAGLVDQIERTCRHADRFARRLAEGGAEILNEVVLNQVLVSFGSDDRTRRVVRAVQQDGTCWCGETVWKGRAAMRISVSSAKTSEEDVDRSVSAILREADRLPPR